MKHEGCVLWFTGLSGAGKSTLADALESTLIARGADTERLDGDSVREVFPATGFSREERNLHNQRIGFMASLLEKHGVIVLASFVSPYIEGRKSARNLCKNFVEIYVSTSLAECERRDVKGLYQKARKGEIRSFTGIDDPFEQPVNPELVIDTAGLTIDECVAIIIEYMTRMKMIEF